MATIGDPPGDPTWQTFTYTGNSTNLPPVISNPAVSSTTGTTWNISTSVPPKQEPAAKINTVTGMIHRVPSDIADTDVNTLIESLDEVRKQLQEVCVEVDSVAGDDDRDMQRELNNAVFYLDEVISSLEKAKSGPK